MTSTGPTVNTRWDAQPTPAAETERLLRLLFGDHDVPTAVSR